MADYKDRFHERLNKLNLAFSYKFSRDRDWAKEHKYFEKLRKKNLNVDCSHFYVEIPQCQPIIQLSTAVIPLGNFFGGLNKSFPSIILRLLDFFDFELQESNEMFNFLLPHSKADFDEDVDDILDYMYDFLDDITNKIEDDIDQEVGYFANIGPYKAMLNVAEADLQFKEPTLDNIADEDELRTLKDTVLRSSDEFERQKYSLGGPFLNSS